MLYLFSRYGRHFPHPCKLGRDQNMKVGESAWGFFDAKSSHHVSVLQFLNRDRCFASKRVRCWTRRRCEDVSHFVGMVGEIALFTPKIRTFCRDKDTWPKISTFLRKKDPTIFRIPDVSASDVAREFSDGSAQTLQTFRPWTLWPYPVSEFVAAWINQLNKVVNTETTKVGPNSLKTDRPKSLKLYSDWTVCTYPIFQDILHLKIRTNVRNKDCTVSLCIIHVK